MWRYSESTEKPSLLDKTSSSTVNYVRKDITLVPAHDDIPDMYTYLENIVPKEDWETYSEIFDNSSEITECQVALTEIYEMLGG